MAKKKEEKEFNLLEKAKKQEALKEDKKPRRIWSLVGKFFIYLCVILILIGLTFSYKVLLSANSVIASSNISSLLGQLKYLIVAPDKMIAGEAEDRVNILLLGMGGAGHSGGYLADTIMIVSYKPSTDQVAFISIPRDLFVPISGFGWRKINNAYAFGYTADNQDGGEKLITEVIENITGLNINYYGRADFEGFRKIIDDVGGIDVYVERSFYDPLYPDYNYGYQPVSFQQGENHFNGEKALQFARSRHGNNNEGTDFARSKRQQKILYALKEKMLSLSILLNPNVILTVLNDLSDHLRTNMAPWEMIKFYKLVQDVSSDQIINEVIDNSPDGPLHAETTIDGAYILRPNAGPDDFSAIQEIAQNIFRSDTPKKEEATIEVQNGTNIAGLAAKITESLRLSNFNVIKIGNASEQNTGNTIIYDLTEGKKPQTLAALKQKLNAEVATTLPAYLYSQGIDEVTYQGLSAPLNTAIVPQGKDVDFVILLGVDAQAIPNSTTSLPINNGD